VAETVGTLVDKLSITELKIHHMQLQVDRTDATPQHRETCANRVKVLSQQRADLQEEIVQLLDDVMNGRKVMKVYRQFKMYNDAAYR
jgi:glycine cleavage system regulatory protein